jgi:anionic cell wall polymer biosynthesis LytR-Cps2A-Psr (LCP) family protein
LRISQTGASRFLLVLIVIILAVGITFAVLFFRSNPVEDALNSNRVINVLFVIENEKEPLSTYVLMYYPGTRRAAIFDIPGELGLLLTRINRVDRIDRVYDPSRINSYENEIEKLLGVEINFNIVITKENLVSLVDLLEGVQIFIPSAVSYRDDDNVILFPSGMTVLDGDKAGVYATYSLEDEEREMEVFRRQRFFIGFLNRQIQMNERLKNPDAAKLYYSFFRTNMNQRTLMFLFDEFVYIDTDRTNIRSVEGTLREVSGQMLIIPLWDGNLVKEVVRQTLGTLTREVEDYFNERSLTIEVLNGTAINGLAGRTAEMLRSFGYDVISISNADNNNYERTEIVYRSADEMMVKDFADLIRCGNVRSEITVSEEFETGDIQDIEYKADITVIIGRDFDGRYVTGN